VELRLTCLNLKVSKTVVCGLNNYYYINARGGGHSYAADAFGGENNHFMVDMSKIAAVTVNGEVGHPFRTQARIY